MSSYSHKSALDELRAKRPATRSKTNTPKYVCWLPQTFVNLLINKMIPFENFESLRATCSSNEVTCNERIAKARDRIFADYAALYRLDRVS